MRPVLEYKRLFTTLLILQLRSGTEEERRDAVLGLTRLDDNDAATALVSALTDVSPAVRALAVAGLGERSDTGMVSHIAARLTSDKDPFVRKAAAYSLAEFSGSDRTSALITGLKDKDQEVRGAAAVALGDHGDSGAVASLTSALSDKNPFVRAHSARALGINGSAAASAVPALVGLLGSDPDLEVKRQAATALGSIGNRSALPALQQARHAGDSHLAQAARDSIKMIEGK
jgi:HEAT repeat protein